MISPKPQRSTAFVRDAVRSLGLWTALGLAFSLPAYLFSGPEGGLDRIVHALKEALPQWYAWGLLFPLIRWADIAAAGTKPLATRLVAQVPLSVLFTTAWLIVRACLQRPLGVAFPAVTGSWYLGKLVWHLPTYWLIFGMWAARRYHDDGRERAVRNAELQASLVQTRLLVLRAQLHPHFLFNALNAVSALMERDVALARRMLADVGDLLRLALDHAEARDTSLVQEIAFVNKYLDIQKIRFGDRLRATVEIDNDVWQARVPTLLLQPLVENAIVHGIAPRASGGTVTVRARRVGDRLQVQIENDGLGLPSNWSLDANAGVGLRNVRERLAQLFPETHRLELRPRGAGGVAVDLELPFTAT